MAEFRPPRLSELLMNESLLPAEPGPGSGFNVRGRLNPPLPMQGEMMPQKTLPIGERLWASPGDNANLAMALIGGPGRGGGNAFGRVSDLRRAAGAEGSTPQMRAFDASRAETDRVLGVIDDALGGASRPPRPPSTGPAPTYEEAMRAIQEALAVLK